MSKIFKPADITRKVLVLGSKGVGKTTFITKLLYNYTPTRYIPTKDDKRYKLTYHFSTAVNSARIYRISAYIIYDEC